MQHIAGVLQLPIFIVDLRHEATHTALPTLAALRLARPHVMSWLKKHYWDAQILHLDQTQDMIHGLLEDFINEPRDQSTPESSLDALLRQVCA